MFWGLQIANYKFELVLGKGGDICQQVLVKFSYCRVQQQNIIIIIITIIIIIILIIIIIAITGIIIKPNIK